MLVRGGFRAEILEKCELLLGLLQVWQMTLSWPSTGTKGGTAKSAVAQSALGVPHSLRSIECLS